MKTKIGKTFIGIGLLLIAAALLITGANLLESYTAGDNARVILEKLQVQSQEEAIATVPALPEYLVDPNREMPTMESEGQLYIGVVEIPALELNLPVLSEWSYPLLKLAPCRYKGTTYRNDLIIMAHNFSTHFGGLIKLGIGDEVLFTDAEGAVYHYQVVELETLEGTAVEEMEAGDWDLTLFTCTRGGAARVTVRCQRMEA